MEIINIIIPKDEGYTLYAEGVVVNKQFMDGGDTILSIDFSKIVILYYTYDRHRRLYIITKPIKNIPYLKMPICQLDGTDKKCLIIGEIRGRTFDRFKESMEYLRIISKGKVYEFDVLFYYQLIYLCRNGKNSKYNLKKLVLKYYPKISIDCIGE